MKSRLFLVCTALGVIGCGSQPSFDLDDQIVNVGGKCYVIPEGMHASDHRATKREILFFQRSGVIGCQNGDLIWESPDAHDKIAYAIRNGDTTIHKRLAKEGKIGCVSPVQ